MNWFDSSVLVAVYVTEAGSVAARRAVARAGQIPLSQLHELEVRTTFERLRGMRAITKREHDRVVSDFDADIAAHRLLPVRIDFDRVFARALTLSASHAARTLARSLDLLHVAGALEQGCDRFVSADLRQLSVARRAGLRTVNLRRRATGLRPPAGPRRAR
jgi:predicted nucleic acid-binding protein